MLLASGAVWADTFRVTNTKDPGTGSLRVAINEANARPDGDVITFAPGVRGDSGLKKALPSLRGEVEIRGPGRAGSPCGAPLPRLTASFPSRRERR